jgi:hypothetical protein
MQRLSRLTVINGEIIMNERIRKLAEQAKIEFTYDPTETPMREFVEAWGGDLEKFAELIVRECADIVDTAISDGGVDGRSLKEHFGVE